MSQQNKAIWYEIRNEDSDEPEILIMDEIGDRGLFGEGVTAKGLAAQLKELKGAKSIKVRINSPGGSVFDGNAIYNALANSAAEINVYVEGMAFSAASVIAMAGDRIEMAKNAMMMIHDPWAVVQGSAEDMERMVDLLGKIKKGIVDTYHGRTGLGKRKLAKMMSDETWMTADESVELGFADAVSGEFAVAASVDLDRFNYENMPEQAAGLVAKTLTTDLGNTSWVKVECAEDNLTLGDESGDSYLQTKEAESMADEKIKDQVEEEIQEVEDSAETVEAPEYSPELLERAKALGVTDLVLGLVLEGAKEDEIKDAMLDAKIKNSGKATTPAPVDKVEEVEEEASDPETPEERWDANVDGLKNSFPDKRHFLALNRMRAGGRIKRFTKNADN